MLDDAQLSKSDDMGDTDGGIGIGGTALTLNSSKHASVRLQWKRIKSSKHHVSSRRLIFPYTSASGRPPVFPA